MTPDLSTPEGRAALRDRSRERASAAYRDAGRHAQDMALSALELEAVADALDAAHATIERLTAPVTEEEIRAAQKQYYIVGCGMAALFRDFIARRKDPTP